MKNLAKICLIIVFLQWLNLPHIYAATTYDWTGANNTAWENPLNWKVGGSVPATSPGASTTDIAQIGVTTSFTVQPVLNTAVTIGSLIIGTQTASTLTINSTLTVTGDITQMNNSSAGGIATNLTSTGVGNIFCTNFRLGDNTKPPQPTGGLGLSNATYFTTLNFSSLNMTVSNNLLLTTTSNTALLSIIIPSANVNNPIFNFNSGTISVGNAIQTVEVGDANLSGFTLVFTFVAVSSNAQFLMNPAISNTANLILKGANPLSLDGTAGYVDFFGAAGGISTVNYNGSVNQEIYTSSAPYSTTSRSSSAPVGLDRTTSMYQNLICSNTLIKKADAGNLTVGGDFTITPTGTATVDFAANSPIVTIGGNLVSNAGATLNQGGTGTMSVTGTSTNAATINQTGSGNITFGGALNNSTTTSTIAQTGTGAIIANGGITNLGTMSQGTGTIGSITITGSLNNSGAVTQTTGNISVSADVTNSGTLTLGSANLTIGGNYTNSGTYTQNTGTTLFNGSSAETLQGGTGAGTAFKTVSFSGAGAKTMTSGNFSVASTSVLTMIGTSSLNVTTGSLTLNSDGNGSAIVAALPAGASITGTVNVQRFIKGSSADLTKRGYRLLSSTVYTASDGTGAHVFDLNYLLNSILVSGLGGTGNGFNITTSNNNPTIYLFREDDPFPPSNSTQFYTSYNWKGVAKLNNLNAYDIGIQKKLTVTNLADTTTTIPVGNGLLVFFRGNKTLNNATTAGTKTTTPYNFPEDVTLTQVGNLNTGPMTVKLWFANSAGLGNNLSFTAGNVSTASSLTGGFTCVGNPYPSTINWEKYNNSNAPGAITGTGTPAALPSKIWVLDASSKQYYAYMPVTNGSDLITERPTGAMVQGSASNFIAGGQAFFVKATQKGQTLSFSESAKISAQPVKGPLSNLMGRPKEFVAQPKTFLRMKLIQDSINTDEMLIALDNSANAKFSDYEDAEDVRSGNALVTLSSFSSDSVKLGINSYPLPGVEQEIIQVTADATSSGSYQLACTQLDNLPILYDVWLKDAFKNDSLSLKTNATYQFTIDKNNPATFGSTRFAIVIRQDTANSYRLLSFKAKKVTATHQVDLIWKTKNEENYTNFTVERSVDGGKVFDVIGGLRGTDAGQYSILDKKPTTGQNLYRLKQQDINDSVIYSRVIPVQYTGGSNDNKVQVYPNPAASTINVAIDPDASENTYYTIRITNSAGLLIRQVTSSQNAWQANVARLLPGTYIVKVHNGKDNSFIGDAKFVKL